MLLEPFPHGQVIGFQETPGQDNGQQDGNGQAAGKGPFLFEYLLGLFRGQIERGGRLL